MKKSLVKILINEFKNLMKVKRNLMIEVRNPYLNSKGNRAIAGIDYSGKKIVLGFDSLYLRNTNPIALSEKIIHELIHTKNMDKHPHPKEKWVIEKTNKFIKSLHLKDENLIERIEK